MEGWELGLSPHPSPAALPPPETLVLLDRPPERAAPNLTGKGPTEYHAADARP